MNQDHFDKWCALLTSGTIEQAQSTLVEDRGDGRMAMCCLGVGMKAMGVEPVISEEGDGFPVKNRHGDEEVQNSLPSWDFLVWLGIMEQSQADSLREGNSNVGDIEIQWSDFDVFGEGQQDNPEYLTGIDNTDFTTCAGMNDNGFTFRQIVDCMRYFGIKPHGSRL